MPYNKISIIIPVLNEYPVVAPLLKSLQLLRNEGHEVIVVDGGSGDGSYQYLDSVCGSQTQSLLDVLIKSKPGRARQMNVGAAQATGRLLWFLHADSQFESNALERFMLNSEPGNDSDWGWFNIRLSGKAKIFRVIERMMNWRAKLTSIATGDQGLFVNKELFALVGEFPEIELMEDIALSKRLKKIFKPSKAQTGLVTSSRRWEQSGILRTIILMWRLRAAYALGVKPESLAQRYRQ